MLHVFTETAPTLSEAQELVGGLVELVRSPTDPEIQRSSLMKRVCSEGCHLMKRLPDFATQAS